MLYSVIIDMAEFNLIDTDPIIKFLFSWLLKPTNVEAETDGENLENDSSDGSLRRLESQTTK